MIHKALVAAAAAALAVGAWSASARPAAAQDADNVTGEQVRAAVQRALAYVRQMQSLDGNWSGGGHRGGVTALALLGMLHAGTPANDPAVVRGLAALDRVPNQATYTVSLKCQVYALLEDAAHKALLEEATNWLINAQLNTGMWSYGTAQRGGRGDNSNTQFALLGLHEAAKAGVKVPLSAWDKSRQHYVNTQCADGGWDYNSGRSSYGSMSVAGLASLYIVGQRLNLGGKKEFINGAYPSCGRYFQNVVLAAGLKWMADNFSVRGNPGKGMQWHLYYLYGLERVGMVSGLRTIGQWDWYREGAAHLVATQGPNGSWGAVYDTVFALLFLAKGNRPVLIQKLKWKGVQEPSWNRNIHDLENFTAFIDDKFGKRVTWQTTTLDLSVQELRASPILFITGHEFPVFTPDERTKLREYVETGGTILAEACCGSKDFEAGFRNFAGLLLPEYRLRPLDEVHPVFRSYFRIEDRYALEGIEVGCRTGVFFSPKALSCLWELQTIPKFSDQALKLGTNIAAYATGKELLQDKLDVVELPAKRKAAGLVEVPRGAIRIARLIHEGDYRADLHFEENMSALLRDKAKVDVVASGRHLKATDELIFQYPVLFMTGHYNFELTDKEIESLRLYLTRGGCLVADACCGRKAFDKSFREMAAKLFPTHPLEPLPAKHPIYTGQIAAPLGELRYRRILADELKSRGTAQPPLEAVAIQGRTAILYSQYDYSCALEADNPYSCRGYIDADGKKLALNIFLYAISY